MKKFEINKKYKNNFIGDSELFYELTVISRTAKTITIKDCYGVKKLRVIKKLSEYKGEESVYPHGSYSMCMVISAGDMI